MSERKQASLVKGASTGFAAGAAATLLMDGYWRVVQNTVGARPEQKPKRGDTSQEKKEPATQVIADKASKAITGEEVPKKDKDAAGVIVHYLTGLSCGVLFGVVAARRPGWGVFAGLLYGAAIWLFLDEIVLRVFNVSPEAEEVPISEHIQALGAHLVYGSGTALFTKLLLGRKK